MKGRYSLFQPDGDFSRGVSLSKKLKEGLTPLFNFSLPLVKEGMDFF
jgi:hypothetical protein